MLLGLPATQDLIVWTPPVLLQNLLYAVGGLLTLVPLKILPLQKNVTGLELTGSLQTLFVQPIESYAFGAQKLPNPLVLPLARLPNVFPTVHLGTVQHLTRVTLGVLSFVLTVPDRVMHLLPSSLVPVNAIPTLGPLPTNRPVPVPRPPLYVYMATLAPLLEDVPLALYVVAGVTTVTTVTMVAVAPENSTALLHRLSPGNCWCYSWRC